MAADVLAVRHPRRPLRGLFYNPFTGLLFARFIERLLQSLERRPRPLRLVYNYPFEHDYVMASGRFLPIDLSYSYSPAWYRRPGYVIVTYEALTPEGQPYGASSSARRPRGSAPGRAPTTPAGNWWPRPRRTPGRGTGARAGGPPLS